MLRAPYARCGAGAVRNAVIAETDGTYCICRGHKLMGNVPSFVLKRWVSTEFDFAGVIVDANATEFKEGDEVFGWHPVCE